MINSNLHVKFLLDVIVCCCLLHNMIMNGKHTNIDELMFAHLKMERTLEATTHGEKVMILMLNLFCKWGTF